MHRPSEPDAVPALHDPRSRHADAEVEPSAGEGLQAEGGRGEEGRAARAELDDERPEPDRGRACGEIRQPGQGVVAPDLGHPQRRDADAFGFARERGRVGMVGIDEGTDSHVEGHGSFSRCATGTVQPSRWSNAWSATPPPSGRSSPTSRCRPGCSSELQEVVWLDGATGVEVGNRFQGKNRHESLGEWATECVVVEVEPERRWVWEVHGPEGVMARWGFEVDPGRNAVTVRQFARMGPAPSGLSIAIEAMPDKESRIISHRLDEWRENITANLVAIRDLIEGERLGRVSVTDLVRWRPIP